MCLCSVCVHIRAKTKGLDFTLLVSRQIARANFLLMGGRRPQGQRRPVYYSWPKGDLTQAGIQES